MPRKEEAAYRHASYYVQLLLKLTEQYEGGEEIESVIEQFEQDWEQIKTGQAWAKRYAESYNAAEELAHRYFAFGYLWFGLRLAPNEIFDWAAPAVSYVTKQEQYEMYGEILTILGKAEYELGHYDQAISKYEEALAIAQRYASKFQEQGNLNNIALVYKQLSQYEKAINYFHQALQIATELNNKQEQCRILGNLGVSSAEDKQYEQAIQFYERALILANEIDDKPHQASWLGNLGNVYIDLSKYEQAIEYLKQALNLEEESGNKREIGTRLTNLGNAYAGVKQYDLAKDYHLQALALTREINNKYTEGATLDGLGQICFALGEYKQALDYFQQELTIFQELNLVDAVERTQGNINAVKRRQKQIPEMLQVAGEHLQQQQYIEAKSIYIKVLELAREIDDKQTESMCLCDLGWIYLELEHYDCAINFYNQALLISHKINDNKLKANQFGNLGIIYQLLGNYQQAISCYVKAQQLFEALGMEQKVALIRHNIASIVESN